MLFFTVNQVLIAGKANDLKCDNYKTYVLLS